VATTNFSLETLALAQFCDGDYLFVRRQNRVRSLRHIPQLLPAGVTAKPYLEQLPLPRVLLKHEACFRLLFVMVLAGTGERGHHGLIGRPIHLLHRDHPNFTLRGRLPQWALELIGSGGKHLASDGEVEGNAGAKATRLRSCG